MSSYKKFREEMKKKYGTNSAAQDVATVKTSLTGLQPFLERLAAKLPEPDPEYRAWLKSIDEEADPPSYFSMGAFDDGYQPFDVAKTILATGKDIRENAYSGVVSGYESIIDAGAGLLGQGAALFGADGFADSMQGFVEKDLLKEDKIARFMDNITGGGMTQLILGVDKTADDYSILGEKTDSLAQSGGQMAISMAGQSVGIPWQATTGTMAFGSEIENAYRNGATHGEAALSGAIAAAGEVILESLFKIPGIDASGSGEISKKILSTFANDMSKTAVSNLLNFGINLVGEGFEEVGSSFIQRLGQALTYERKETIAELIDNEEAREHYVKQLAEKLFGREAQQEYKDSFHGGMAFSAVAGAPRTVKATLAGVDAETGLTPNEKKVFDKEVEKRVAEKEADGVKLSGKEKADIEAQVKQALENGDISIETIEEALGGKDYEAYRKIAAQEDSILTEYEELGKKQQATLAEQDRFAELKATIQDMKKTSQREALKQKVSDTVYGLAKADRLVESYNERSRRTEAFQADVSQYSAKQQATIRKAIDSGILNNTNKTHRFVDWLAKITADKGISFDFADNQRLKESGFAIDGRQVNGYVTKDGVTLNINSAKALNSVVGHEIAHVLEGSPELYSALESDIIEYAKSIGEYDTRLKKTQQLYSTVYSESDPDYRKKIQAELVADMVGDYLFTDEAFVKRLATGNRSLFQKIFDEIKYLCRVSTAGSEEARQLEKVKKTFQEIYRSEAKNTAEDGGVRYSLTIRHTDGTVTELSDARHLTDAEATQYLYQAKAGLLQGRTYVPVRKNTPQVVIDTLAQVNEIVEDRSLVMQVRKAQQAMSNSVFNGTRGGNKRGHGLTPENIIEIMNKLDEPSFAVYQTNRTDNDGNALPNNAAFFVEYSKDGGEAVAVIEFDSVIAPDAIGTEFGETKYHTIVTVFEPDIKRNGMDYDYATELLSNPNNTMLEIVRKQPTGSATRENSPNTSSKLLSDNSISTIDEKVNSKSSLSQENLAPVSTDGFQVTGKDIALENRPLAPLPGDLQQAEKLPDNFAPVREDILPASDRLSELGERYGWLKPGEKPAREVKIPKKTAPDRKVSQTVRTILEAEATPEEAVPTIEALISDGVFSYEVYGDQQAQKDAVQFIQNKGWEKAKEEWLDNIKRGTVNKKNTTIGWMLYNNAANSGNIEQAMRILDAIVANQRDAARAMQANRILKKLSPESQLYGVVRTVKSLQQELYEKYKKKAPELKIDETLAAKFLEAKTDAERESAKKAIYLDIGKQMPSNFADKFRAWRYLAMLGNPRTHVRNIIGNAFFAPVVATKNLVATGIESAVRFVSGNKLTRSKSLTIKLDVLKAAWNDYSAVEDIVSGDGKYSETTNANKYIEEGRVIFQPGKLTDNPLGRTLMQGLEAIRKGNSKALEVEDIWFAKPHYAFALASYCSANGITAEQVNSGKNMDAARAYAIKEAQKATYRDTNQLSALLSSLKKPNPDSFMKKAGNMALEGILPFRKTPANILVRGLEYSPAGLMNGIKQAVYDVKKGTKTGAEAIDSISAGLTGTGLMALGMFLAAEGLVRGHGGDDEDKRKFEELLGHQPYALELPNGQSYTLDWLAPEALPFFIGVNLYEMTQNGKENIQFKDVLSVIGTVSEPLLEMSCLQSLNDLFESVGYASSNDMSGLTSALSSAATSYLTQAQPTLLGQLERIGEAERMTTYTEADSPLTGDMQYLIGRVSGRLPGLDYNQIPYIDAWGRVESNGTTVQRAFNNLLNPGYSSTVDISEMETALMELYDSTGEDAVFPERAKKYFTVDGERVDLTAEAYVQYATAKGQASYDMLTTLTECSDYKQMDDLDKVAVISRVYDYTNAVAKTEVSDYTPDGWIGTAISTCADADIDPVQYILMYEAKNKIEGIRDANGKTIDNSRGLQIMKMVYEADGLTNRQRKALFDAFGVGKSIISYDETAVNKALARISA